MKSSILGVVVAATLLLAPAANAQTGFVPIGDPETDTLQLWSGIAASIELIAQDIASAAAHAASAVQHLASAEKASPPGPNGSRIRTPKQLPPALAQTASVVVAALPATATISENEQRNSAAPQQLQSRSQPRTYATGIDFLAAPAANTSAFVTEDQFNTRISALDNSLRQFIAADTFSASASPPLGGGASNTIAAASNIGQLNGVTITNANLTASEIPDLSGSYLSLSGGSLSGALAVPYLTTASSTATSTFAGNVSVAGNVNFNGTLLQNGLPVVSSQWTTSGSNIYYTAGNVGIGTTSPAAPLELFGSNSSTNLVTGGGIFEAITNADQTAGNFDSLSYREVNSAGAEVTGTRISGVFNSHIAAAESADLAFLTRNAGVLSEKVRITGAGNVGIGTTSPFATLSVNGSAYLSGALSLGDASTTRKNLGLAYATAADFPHIVAWGDSLTYGTEPSVSYTSQLSLLTGIPVYNGGENGDTSSQISTRMLAATDKYGWPTIIWAGRNDITGVLSTDESTIDSNIASMVSALQSAGNNNYIVLSVTNADSEPSGSTNYNEIIQINSDLAATYGSHYLDVREYLVQNGLTVAGITPSATDLTDISEDIPPASLRWDGIHFNVAGNLVIAKFLQQNLGLLITTPSNQPVLTTTNLTNFLKNPPTFSFVDSASGYNQNGVPILQGSSTLSSIALGQGALNTAYTGTFNTALGPSALSLLTTGGSNTAVGYNSLNNDTTGNKNVGMGAYSLADNTTGGDNIAAGFRSLFANTTGSSNVAMGDNTLALNVTGTRNVGIAGFGALTNSFTGSDNIAIGNVAENDNQSPTSTVAVGSFAANGSALYSNQGFVAIGYKSGFDFQTGSDYNTLVGYQSGFNLTTGSHNIFIGAEPTAGNANESTGSQNIGIGYNIAMASSTASNQLDIGNIIFGTGLTGTGNNVAGRIGIGTTTPSSIFELSKSNSGTTITTFGDPALSINNSNTTDNDFASVALRGTNSSGAEFTGAEIAGVFTTHTAGSESGDLVFLTDNSGTIGERARIKSSGNVGIGTINPYSRLQVTGPDTASTSAFAVVNSASTTAFAVYDNGNATYSGSIFQSSDQRLKTAVQSLDESSSLSSLLALNPVSYTRIDQPGQGENLGFIAQQVANIFPELVSTTSPTALTPDGTLTLNYVGLIAPIVNAIQSLSAELTSIENTIAGFAQSFISNTITANNELCVGSTCVTPAQFQAMAAAANVSQSSGQGSGVARSSNASTTPDTPPLIQINGDNPAIVDVGGTYNDLGATITGPEQDLNLGIQTYLDGTLTSNIIIDTSEPVTDTIDYVATDQSGLSSTSSRTVIVQPAGQGSGAAASSTDASSTPT